MKVTVEVDCSPEEARRFIGLPDVTPMNDMLVREMTDRMQQNIQLMAPDQFVRSWMSVGAQAQDAFVRMMTSAAGAAMGPAGGEER